LVPAGVYSPLTELTLANAPKETCERVSLVRLDKQKGFENLILAFKKIYSDNPEWSLDIYGDGPEKDSLNELIDKNNLKDKVRVEVKYYECYYDFYTKKTSTGAYFSLKLDDRDRLSVYIDDLKEGLVFDNDELSRYIVKISINPNDADRIGIQD
jgi:hypothetical protein